MAHHPTPRQHTLALAAALTCATGSAQAFSFETEGGLRGDFNTTISLGTQLRL